MIAYVDSSVLLRKLFGEPGQLTEWRDIEEAYASRLLTVEVLRVVDRCRLEGRIDDVQVVKLHERLREVVRSIELIALDDTVLTRASAAMPTVLGTLDAIHLATALVIAADLSTALIVTTHDVQLARAARASGFDVLGA
jgi:predicted nucleic acid-binding protein